jgi:hypothetical protein
MDHETYALFKESNFDAYDRERYPAVLKAGLAQHGLALSDVLAVTSDLGLWAICTVGVFRGDLRGLMKKRIEIGPLIRYAELSSIEQEPHDPGTTRIVLNARDGKRLARLDLWLGGTDGTRAGSAVYQDHIYRILREASATAR